MTARTSTISSQRPQFAACDGAKGSYDLWTCRETRLGPSLPRQDVDGRFPNDRFSAVFFQPFYAGQTFGIGQLNPLTALEMSDIVHRVSGLPRLDAGDPRGVYKTIMDPDLTLPYVAATLKKSIDAYKIDRRLRHLAESRAHRDALQSRQSRRARPRSCKAENNGRRQQGLEPRLPRGKLLRLAGQREAAGAAGAVLTTAAKVASGLSSAQNIYDGRSGDFVSASASCWRSRSRSSLPRRAMLWARRLASSVAAGDKPGRVDDDARVRHQASRSSSSASSQMTLK